MNTEGVVQTDSGLLLSHKKNEMIAFAATRTDLQITILSEVKPDKEIQILQDITYMWNLKYDTNEVIYEIEQTHRQTYH